MATGAAPVAERVIRSQSANYVVMSEVERFTLKRGATVEPLLVQHSIFMVGKVAEVVQAGPDPASPPADPATATPTGEVHFCRWSYEAFLQRQVCFASISGLTGCTDPVTSQLPDVETGDYEFDPAAPGEAVCNDTHPLVTTARQRAEQRVRALGKALMAADTRDEVLAGFGKLGLTVESR